MEAVVARADRSACSTRDGVLGVRRPVFPIESELHDHVGTGVVLRRFQDVVAEAGDVRHKGATIRGICHNRVGAGGGLVPIERRCANRAVRSDGRRGGSHRSSVASRIAAVRRGRHWVKSQMGILENAVSVALLQRPSTNDRGVAILP